NMPGDDGWTDALVAGSSFVVQRSTWPRDVWDYDSTTDTIRISTNGVTPSTTVYYTLTGLDPGVTYYLRIWHSDEVPNWSEISNAQTTWAKFDSTPPAKVTDLYGEPGTIEGDVILSFTSPGDDEMSGQILSGELRIMHTKLPGVQPSTGSAQYIEPLTNWVLPNTPLTRTITELENGTTYYLNICIADEAGNWAVMSNTATTWAQIDNEPPAAVTQFNAYTSYLRRELDLNWIVPGDHNWERELDPGSKFKIQYSTWASITWDKFSVSDTVEVSTDSVRPGTRVYYTITGLYPSATHYLKIWHVDEAQNWSEISVTATAWAHENVLFNEYTAFAATGVYMGDVEWVDFDSDGDLDIAVSGQTAELPSPQEQFRIYSNDGLGNFTNLGNRGISNVYMCQMDWGDYDNDGDLDVVISGTSGLLPPVATTKIFKNTNNVFSDISAGLTGIYNGDVKWGDYDNDGDLDLAVCSEINTTIYRNDGGNNFVSVTAALSGGVNGIIDWGDYDSDGDLDIAICGNYISTIYRNDNNNAFVDASMLIIGVSEGFVSWADYDNDGDLDLAICGEKTPSPLKKISRIYRNQGGTFGEYDFVELLGVDDGFSQGSLSLGDYDNDGDLDIAMFGYTQDENRISVIARNMGNDVFQIKNAGFDEVYQANAVWGDFDNDTDLDIAYCGWIDSSTIITKVYRNDGADENVSPSPPENFTAVYSTASQRIELRWNPPSAGLEETPQNGLYYEIGIATRPYNENPTFWIVSMDHGLRTSPFFGKYSPSVVSSSPLQLGVNINKSSLASQTTYYSNVRSIDTGFAKSSLAATSFYVPDIHVPAAVTGLVGFPGDNRSEAILKWNIPGDDGITGVLETGSKFAVQYSTWYAVEYSSWVDVFYSTYSTVQDTGTVSFSWSTASAQVEVSTQGITPLTYVSHVVTGLNAGSTYFFKIWHTDEAENLSDISNTATTWAQIDDISPGQVTDLSASVGPHPREILLSWGVPGRDGYDDPLPLGSQFRVQYTTWTELTWDYENAQVVVSTFGVATGTLVSYMHNVENSDTAYYFKIWHADEFLNWSLISNTATAQTLVDISSPAKVTLLAVPGTLGGEIDLSWQAPGDDEWYVPLSTGSQFLIQHSTWQYITWSTNSAQVKVSTDGVMPLTTVYYTVTGLDISTTYYLRLWNVDAQNNYSIMSDSVSARVDVTEPGKVTDLEAFVGYQEGDIILQWSAPGNDDNENVLNEGSKFVIQYSTDDMVQWSTASIQRSIPTSGATPASAVSYTVTGLLANDTYYFKLWHYDEFQNLSEISNTATGYAHANILFQEIGAGLTGFVNSAIAWGDYDNDNDLDLLVSGLSATSTTSVTNTTIYKNDSGVFTDINTGIVGFINPSAAWGDYDNDGDLDFAICGSTDPLATAGISSIYRNDNEVFVEESSASIAGIAQGSLAWGDYNNDGYIDLAICGDAAVGGVLVVSYIYKNNGDGTFTNINAILQGVYQSSLAWGDYDNDGDLDLAIAGNGGVLSDISTIYENNGDDTFTDIEAGLVPMYNGSLAWGDYDNDGDLDFAICGSTDTTATTGVSSIYRNDNLTFNDINAPLEGCQGGSVSWGDYDTDGDLDLVVCGRTDLLTGKITRMYRNNTGLFEDAGLLIETLSDGAVVFGDYDNDGALDFALSGNRVTGVLSSETVTRIYRNIGADANVAPNAPTNFSYSFQRPIRKLELKWDSASDTRTPPDGLHYEIRMASESITGNLQNWIISPSTGRGMTPFMGNYPQSKLDSSQQGVRIVFESLKNEATYYWQVRTIDTGFAKSDWSTIQSVYIEDSKPPAGITNLSTYTGSIEGEMDLSWYSPGDDGWEKALSTGSIYKIQYSSWLAEFSTSSAQITISTNSVSPMTTVWHTITGLVPDQWYYSSVWCMDESQNWSDISNIAFAQIQVDVTPPALITMLSAQPGVLEGEANLSWTMPGDDIWENTLSTGSKFAIQPSTWNTVVWSTASLDVVIVSTNGVSPHTTVSNMITGLTGDETYYFRIWHMDESQNWSDMSYITTGQTQKDVTEPEAVTNLSSTQGLLGGEIELSWNTPGDDGWNNDLSQGTVFKVQYSTWELVEWTTATAAEYTRTVSTSGTHPHEYVKYSVTGLDPLTTYFMKIWYADDYQLWSDSSNITSTWAASYDVTDPSTVTDLDANIGFSEGQARLSWSAPTDDIGSSEPLDYTSQFVIQRSTWPDVTWSTTSVDATIWEYASGETPLTQVLYTVTDLTPGLIYYFKIWHVDEAGRWSQGLSNTATAQAQVDVTAPARITDLTGLTGEFEGEVYLEWSLPGDDVWENTLSTGSQFKILYSTVVGTWNRNGAQITISTSGVEPASLVSYTVTGLTSDELFYFIIWYADEVPNWSDGSSTITARAQYDQIPPSDVTTLTSQPGIYDGEINLSWAVPGDDNNWEKTLSSGSQFTIQHSSWDGGWDKDSDQNITVSSHGVIPKTYVSYTLTGLTLNDTYYMKIWYADELENWSGSSNGTSTWAQNDLVPPADITNLSANTGVDEGEIDLTWDMPGNNGWEIALASGAEFAIQKSTWPRDVWDHNSTTDTVKISTFGVTPHTPVSYTVTGLTGGDTYYFRIWHADKKGNWAEISNGATNWAQIDFTAPAQVGQLDTITALTGVSGGEIDLFWSSPGDDNWTNVLSSGSVYIIQHSSYSADWSTGTYGTTVLPADGTIPFAPVAKTVTGLIPSVTYFLRVQCVDESNNYSVWSDTVSAWAQLVDDTPPRIITDLVAQIGGTEGEIYLSWTTPGDDDSSGIFLGDSQFVIQKESVIPLEWSTASAQISVSAVGTLPDFPAFRTLTGLTPGETYYMRIWYMDDSHNWADVSNGATAWAQVDVTPPAAVTNLAASNGTLPLEIDLTWSTPGDDNINNTLSSGSEFRIQYSTSNSGWNKDSAQIIISTNGVPPQTSVSYTVTNLTADVTMYFVIWHSDERNNWSSISNTASEILVGFIEPYTYTDSELIAKGGSGTLEILPETGKIEAQVESGTFAEDVVLTLSTDTVAGSNQASIQRTAIGIEMTNNKNLQPEKEITITIRYRNVDIAGL
ncbi:FG-GAP-like repeat-containing protein, partial [Elusimicrobiota bacterium]